MVRQLCLRDRRKKIAEGRRDIKHEEIEKERGNLLTKQSRRERGEIIELNIEALFKMRSN